MIRTGPSLVLMVDQLTRCTPQALRPPHPAVLPPSRPPRGGVEAVTPVDKEPPSGERSCVRGRKLSPVLVPLCDHDHGVGVGVGPGERSVAVECLVEVRVHTLRVFKSLWISHHHLRAQPMQSRLNWSRPHLLRDKEEATGLHYRHAVPHEYPLLWVSDAVAWCYSSGGDWMRRAEPLVESRLIRL